MAGESPDRSKQHEASASSAEATPGTPAAVAGPNRAAAAAAADPRLAVARERAATVRVDQATAVFSTRALAEGSAGSGGKGPGPGEDARLREAVAAWVAGADEEAPEGESEVPEASKGPEGPDKASKGAEKAGTAAEAGTGAEAETEAGAEVEAEVEAAAGVAGEVDGESASGSDADAGADSDAAADDDSDSDSDSGSTSDADSDAKSASEGEVEAEGTVADDADTDADAEPKTDAKSTSDAESETAPESESETEAETKSETEDAKPAEAKSSPEDASETSEPSEETAEKTSETSETSADSEGLEDFASPEASSDVEDAKDAKDSEDSAAQKDSKDTPPADGSASADDSPSAKDAPDTDDAPEPPVDQPTAIFKAPKRTAVDQPTTMLKLGGAKPATDKPADQPKAEQPKVEQSKADQSKADRPKPESPSERTSKFVALKPLDEPVSRVKPKTTATPPVPSASSSSPTKVAPADATAALPQVGPERTTQQPLPPKPPLDLLAELTNTPPPPQTPVRTLARRVKIWTPLVLLLAVIFAVAQSLRPLPTPTLDLTAESSYTFGGGDASIPWPSSGQGALDVQGIGSFGTSGAQKAAPIASVAKVMTAYLILRDHPIKSGDGAKIKVDQKAQDQSDAGDESTVNVHAGDTITQKEALEGVLIASANNVARLLARWDAGSETAFVAKMNAAAKDLGMTNTTYTDPSGLTKTTVSTAADQVKLAKAAMKDASFREVARMMEYTDYKGTRHSNWNHLVGSNNVIGIKTGTTTAAGGNLVFAATKEIGGEVRTIVGAVISQGPGGSDNTILGGALAAGDKLIRAAQASLKSATILKKGDVVGYVDDGLGGRTPVVITKDVTAVGWAGLKVKLSFVSSELPHSAKAGTKVGSLTVGDGGSSSAVQVPVELQKDLAEPGFGAKLTRVS
ncbi:D-alanyl-D-alanine carboxypeptidase [Streptomyces mirabilis]|uniref:D-alanyl-D-alanine carboxypeptidase n=1 Tax=Streptomyces mirabilis TaxID=68239 RepID=UPI0035DCBB2D